jgi:hypothetical protein
VGDPDGPGVGDALAGLRIAGTGTGAATTVAALPAAFLFIAAILAAISARFLAMRSAPDNYRNQSRSVCPKCDRGDGTHCRGRLGTIG